jgi:hypothetical protein
MKTIEELPEPIRGFYAAFQKGDLEQIRSFYDPEAVLRDPGIGFLLGHLDMLAIGVDTIVRYFHAAFSNMPEPPRVELRRWWQAGDDIIVEYSEAMMTYLEVFTVAEGKIKAQQVFWGSIPPAPLLRPPAH